ncbi:MAG: M23 family metallopeptidase [Acidobacteriota bacterium]
MSSLRLLFTLLVLPSLAFFEKDSTPSELEISHRARSLQPGEVVLITAKSKAPLQSMQGRAFSTMFPFYPTRDQTVWQGLIGIDLETTPGTYRLSLEGATEKGSSIRAQYKLQVMRKEFPTRRLRVAEKYVNPPAEVLARIRKESKRVNDIFEILTPEKIWGGSFLSPVPGAPTSGFGKRSILNDQPRSPHGGTDFNAEAGTPVKAPNKGKVVLASNLYYSGNTVILDHGHGLYSYFAHLSRFAVAEGKTVAPGEMIGYVGATGRVTGPHLHWSVRLNGTRVDPLSLIAVFLDGNVH